MKTKTKKKRSRAPLVILLVFLALIFALIALYAAFTDNVHVDYEYFTFHAESDEEETTKIKFIHLSDMHFSKLSVDTDGLLARITSEKPDFIAITGDLIDFKANFDSCGVYPFLEKLVKIAPVYYASGNHEYESGKANEFFTAITERGVVFLQNKSENIEVKGKHITLMGITDNALYGAHVYGGNEEIEDNYKILLAHRPNPDKWKNYSEGDYILPDLVLSGHVHGGQFRIFGQGLVAPQQWILPKIDAGLYVSESGKTSMIVSRGLGNSMLPHRVNNPPHVPIVLLYL